MRKPVFIFACILFFDLLFFSPLFFPSQKLIVTPEFGGGDTVTVQLPYRYKLCEKVKQFTLPFWSKDMAAGYPLLAEGEIGAFNPVNLATCFFFDYKTAFNLQIVIHTLIGQIGLLILAAELDLTIYAGLFLSILFPFTPLLLMNYMQITLIYPLFYLPYLLYSLLKLIKDGSFRSFLLLSFFVFLQFTVSHYQTFFISFIFLAGFLLSYLYIDRKRKKKIRLLFIFFLAYIIGVLLAGFQLIPSIEFFMNSNRSSEIYGSFASTYDQNLGIKNFLTLFSPYLFGKPQNGTLSSGMALPWEGTFFIYYLPLLFLIVFVLKWKKLHNKIIASLIISFFAIGLIAVGKNSPLYFIHSLPVFSSFRFPSRFVFILIFIMAIFSSIGFDFILEKIHIYFKRIFVFIVICIVFLEAYGFNYSFHVLLDAKKLFQPGVLSEFIAKNGSTRIYSPISELSFINNFYFKKPYKDSKGDSLFLYYYANETLFPQINLINRISNLATYIGPQLKRNPIMADQILDKKDMLNKDNTLKLKTSASNMLRMAGVKFLITRYPVKDEFLKLRKTFKIAEDKNSIYLYEIVNSYGRVQFHTSIRLVRTYLSFLDIMSTAEEKRTPLFIENVDLVMLFSKKRVQADKNPSFILQADEDIYIRMKTKTSSDSLLVLADNYYPGWKAFVDGKETNIYRANLFFRGISLPRGDHTVEFKYIPYAFWYGCLLSFFCGFSLLIVWGIWKRKKDRLKRIQR